jgi:hypothetical protein
MAGSFSDYLENGLLNYVFGETSFVPSGTLHIALSIADPLDDISGLVEPLAGSGYARAAVVNDKAVGWTVSSAGTLSNKNDITFPEATGAGWGTITHFAIMSEPTGTAHMLGHADLTVSKVIANGDTPKFSAGDLDISLT